MNTTEPSGPRASCTANSFLSRPLLTLALLSALACVAAVTVFKMANNDIWLHLATGEWILTHGRVPDHDPFSFVTSGRPYVAHEWLSAVVLSLVHSVAGVSGLTVFKALVIIGVLGLLYGTSRALGGRLAVFLPFLGAVAYIGGERFIERPHIFTYLLTASFLFLFFRFREGGRDVRLLYAMLPLQVLWTNLHGGWVQGMALLVILAGGEVLHVLRARHLPERAEQALDRRQVLTLVGLLPACLLATLVNPYGVKALLLPFELTGMKVFMARIYEWQPPYAPSFNDTTMFALYLGLVIGTLTAFFAATGAAPGAGPGRRRTFNRALTVLPALTGLTLLAARVASPGTLWRPDILRAALVLLLVLLVVLVLANWRVVDFTQTGIIVLFYALSLRHNRAVTDAALVLLPIGVAAASACLERRLSRAKKAHPGSRHQVKEPAAPPTESTPGTPCRPRADRSSPVGVVCGSLVLVAVAAHVTVFNYYFSFSGATREKGLGVASSVPTTALDFIVANRITGNAFVTYGYGALLAYWTSGTVKVSMDSRNEVYGEQLFVEYERALQSAETLAAYLAGKPIDFLLLANDSLPAEIVGFLARDRGWAIVYRDELATVVVKQTPEHSDLIRRFGPGPGRPQAKLTFPET